MTNNSATRTAIERAIEGGWELPETPFKIMASRWHQTLHPVEIADRYPQLAVLDPAFWMALGKTEGWDAPAPEGHVSYQDATGEPYAHYVMDRLMPAMRAGKTPDQFLATILKTDE